MCLYLQPFFREFSSAGSEHLPYKQRVTGSNPVTPTKANLYGLAFLFKNKGKAFIYSNSVEIQDFTLPKTARKQKLYSATSKL